MDHLVTPRSVRTIAGMAEQTPIEAAAQRLLAEGGTRYEAGAVVGLPSGTKLLVASGWAAVRGSRVFCTGRLEEQRATPECAP